MNNIFIDPIIVMTPPVEETQDGVRQWLTNLSTWLKEALTSPHTWLHSVKATHHLYALGRFPEYETLRIWQTRYGLDINIKQIARNVNSFFRNEAFDLERNLEQEGYLVEADHTSIQVNPQDFGARWPLPLRDDVYLLLAFSCACKHMGSTLACALSIATLALAVEEKQIEVTARIAASEPAFEWQAHALIIHTFPLLFTPADLLPTIDILALWQKGEPGVRYAVDQFCKRDWPDFAPVEYRFGPRFFESIAAKGIDAQEALLMRLTHIMAAVIADQAKHVPGYKLHHVRKSRGSSEQRVRESDGARCWRIDVTMHGAGWRLHYWQVPLAAGFLVEFECILREQDPV